MIKHINIKIHGLVQGVFFRVKAKEKARKLNIVGFAKNEIDGTVYIETEGEEKDLEEFIKWCKMGPDLAKVDTLEIKKGPLKNFKTFDRDYQDYTD